MCPTEILAVVLFVVAVTGGAARMFPAPLTMSLFLLSFVFLFAYPNCHRAFTHGSFCFGYEIPNPYYAPQAGILAVLIVVAFRWLRVRPQPRRIVRAFALHAASLTVAGASLGLDAPQIGPLTATASMALIVCLLIELRLHTPPIPRAVAR